jgi:hypothetical protein
MTPTARTLALLRDRGYLADVAERWLPRVNVRRDLFGCIDVVAIKAGCAVLGVQATTATNVSHRISKARELPALRTWLACNAQFQVWGWAKRAGRWQVRIVELRGDDLGAVVVKPEQEG